MVNGKPQLTFGGGQITAPKRAKQNTGLPQGNRTGADFASYLPVSEYGQKGGAVAKAPAGQARQALLAPQSPLMAQSQAWGGTPNLGATTAPLAAPNNSANARAMAENMPTGVRSLNDARAQGNATARMAFGMSNVGNLAQPQRVAAKSAPRISGQPVTGRAAIGMEDTRRTVATRKTAAAGTPSSRSLGIMEAGANGLPAMDPFSNFSARFQAGAGHQSFVTHGFASKNAQAVLKSQGYDLTPARNVQTKATLLQAPAAARPAAKSVDDAAAAVRVANHKRKDLPLPQGKYPERSLVPSFYAMADTGLGNLAAKFESGDEGIAAIGYDRKGGTSYGKYQISSRAGTMKNFIAYLQEKAPDLAQRLASAGPANTGGRNGKMPAVWRQIAAEDSQRFENLQSDFIRTSHFEPALSSIAESTGVGFNSMPKALQEVLFSTAVQHGPAGAVRIVNRALNAVGSNKLQKIQESKTEQALQAGRQLIQQIYALRAGQFSSSTARVQAAVRNRLRNEMHEALQMLS